MLMKSAFLSFAVAALLLGSGCDKDSSPSPGTPSTNTTKLSAKINGSTFYATEFTYSSTDSSLVIGGSANETSRATMVTFRIRRYVGIGTYSVDSATTAVFAQLGMGYPVSSGSVSIVTDNAVHIAGTFNLEAGNGAIIKSLTDGSFDFYK